VAIRFRRPYCIDAQPRLSRIDSAAGFFHTARPCRVVEALATWDRILAGEARIVSSRRPQMRLGVLALLLGSLTACGSPFR